ncbi:MAG: cystathionine gamma-synthase [Deltaproteobacteria bacterium RIFCSPLOWO2_01_44_7]|nr:MAG: cystathionine gamma-synthase [Deltaproteobacteria bacterium RIFCSPHIGHO2_01_FULL_43_49]OGQ15310.1 MAG: cystathionine gamma-synthase [Deltaproteobacteria bacterium RIFCSPHIGHO2_02_FULL_44_53]OGQ27066.1 MAG: cystathionine gamma-synthase [Deltaproteobacteria bacterium RIFCSPHIGHO2_12_FULL_44_21]OGQ31826.1 MAG: cystathionine gamma-synthase [Deltaproteobacteria bacterium RIFCSPLOWO2_01_FULL_45_74]OGQ37640.1 MAG: cystathionine gamma-synthase [Deltaproteobacteria bacterium RIFCSPLOWO2_01_44_7]
MKGFNTKAVHVGQKPEGLTGAVISPIYQTSTYAQEAPGKHKGFDYTRADNPNYRNLEAAIAALEEGAYATVFSSGIGAELAVLNLLKAGDHVVAGDDLYGGTYRLFTQWGMRFGLSFDFVDGTNPKAFEKAIQKKTKLIWIETPTNPLLKTTDIKAVATIAKKKKILTVADNTFATPYFQKPLNLGAAMSLHSTTKYIGGHSDVIGGVVVTNDKKLKEKLNLARMSLGINPSPFDCWLTQRGLKTLGLRMERHQENAKAVVQFFKKHPLTKKVYYPGFGGMVSAEFKLTVDQTKKLISSFEYFTLGESLGGVESLVCHPATMTHASIPPKERVKRGLSDSLVRFSVGIEDVEDLLDDLKNTLSRFG